MKKVKKLSLDVGPFSFRKSIKDQLRKAGITQLNSYAVEWEKDSDAITRLAARNLITDREKWLVRKRLIKYINRIIKEQSQ